MKRKKLIIGSGGREHALAQCFMKSPTVEKVYVAPGNPGMIDCATIINIQISDFEKISDFVQHEKIAHKLANLFYFVSNLAQQVDHFRVIL